LIEPIEAMGVEIATNLNDFVTEGCFFVGWDAPLLLLTDFWPFKSSSGFTDSSFSLKI
jgi:hypothetical protein